MSAKSVINWLLGALITLPGLAATGEPPWAKPLDDLLKTRAEAGFAGGVVVEQDGKLVFEKTYGIANREKNIPWTLDTVYCLGSITKQFTAAAIVKLQTEGKLSVSDSISKWIPDLSADKSKITLHHLLTHSAGVPDFFGGEFHFDGDFEPRATEQWTMEQFRACKLLWGPEDFGKKYQYSNAGYSLLAIVVGKASGIPYETFLHKTFFDPLGMTRTGYFSAAWKPDGFAHSYKGGKDTGVVVLKHALPDGPSWNLRGNGGICTTFGDMLKWHHALIDHTVFDEATLKLIETPYLREGPNANSYYGYGWALVLDDTGAVRYRGHNGGDGVNFADFRWYPPRKLLVLAASTTFEVNLEKSMSKIMQTIVPPAR